MKDKTIQKELFEDLSMPKKKKKKQPGILPKNFVLFNVTYDQMIFITIAVIMLMVLVFSLGVERGKGLVSSTQTKKEEKTMIAKEERPSETKNLPIELPKTFEVEAEKRATDSASFTIQIVAYRSKKLAQQELIRLSKKGYDPFIIVGGGYYQICVGKYRKKGEARKDLAGLKKTYKDSFIRKR